MWHLTLLHHNPDLGCKLIIITEYIKGKASYYSHNYSGRVIIYVANNNRSDTFTFAGPYGWDYQTTYHMRVTNSSSFTYTITKSQIND
jgi:hypothetical protein